MKLSFASFLSGLGKFLIVSGVLILLFAGFQLWGTGIAEARAQSELETTFTQQLVEVTKERETADTSDLLPLPSDTLPEPGSAIGVLEIESIGLEKTFVEGVTRDVLRDGPGRYPETSFPGQPGNSAIAGHRTTYGAPFIDLDKVTPGDTIKVTTLQGEFFYEIDSHEDTGEELGYFIVPPTATDVLEDRPGEDTLTLTACHPKYSAAQRLIVTATLTSPPAPETEFKVVTTEVEGVDPLAEDSLTESLDWQPDELQSTTLWALITAAVGFTIWTIAQQWRKIPTLIIGAAPFLIVLFSFFTQLEKLLPAV